MPLTAIHIRSGLLEPPPAVATGTTSATPASEATRRTHRHESSSSKELLEEVNCPNVQQSFRLMKYHHQQLINRTPLYKSVEVFFFHFIYCESFMKSSDITHNPDYDLFNWNPSTKPNMRDRYHKVQCLMSCQVRLDQSDKERSLGWMQRHLTKPHASGAPIVFWNRGIRHHKAATIINVNTDMKIQWQWSHRARSPFLTMETDLPKYKSIFTTIMPAATITIIFYDNGPLESHSRLSQYIHDIWLTQ